MSTLKKNEYHHGDLRNTLVQLGVEMLAEDGEANLSLRKLAKRAGVSHNAPYQHFSDKNALLAAIAEEGFRILGVRLDEIIEETEGAEPQAQLIAAGQTYVEFATTHPNHLQMMFGSLPNETYPDLSSTSLETMGKLISIVKRARKKIDEPEADTHDVALTVWMVVHGISATLIADKIPSHIRQERTPEQLTERFLTMLYEGIG